MTRILIVLLCAGLLAAVACSGGSPTSPATGGATIAGTVVRGASAPSSGLTVSVAGTTLSSPVDASDTFQLEGVPTGDVQLVFGGSEARPTVSVSNVAPQEMIQLQVAIAGGVATVQREVRGNGGGRLVLCHRDGDNVFHPIEVSVNAEAANRTKGDVAPGEEVPGDPSRIFDDACRMISPVEIKKFTNGQDADEAPGPRIPVGSPVSWTYVVTNRSPLTFTSLSVTDDRGVAVACPRDLPAPGASVTCTASGMAVAGQYSNVGTVTVTAKGKQFTASDASHYFGGPLSGVTIEKFTNGQRVSQAPGPSIPVGGPVSWTYVITNTSALPFASVSVTDDRGVLVACPRVTLVPGASMSCTGSGTAVAGQYRNVGTVVATAAGVTYTATDASFYFGREAETEQKVQLCHRTGNGSYHMIDVSIDAEPAHRAHGDGKVGEQVPGNPGHVFTASCTVR
jgi:hypothetical protein